MTLAGIVRRIDELGRVVIPKEIRRTLRIREGDPLEIFTDREGEVILKKYSPLGELTQFATQCADSLAQVSGCGIVITDRDHIVAGAGGKKELVNRHISNELEDTINERRTLRGSDKTIPVIDGEQLTNSETIVPIICEGDVIGSVVLISKDGSQLTESEYKMAAVASGFLGKQMES